MRIAAAALVALAWTLVVAAVTIIAWGDVGSGLGAAYFGMILLATVVLGAPLALGGAWAHHRRYGDRRLFGALVACTLLAAGGISTMQAARTRARRPPELPPLHAACEANDLDRVRALLEESADVNEVDAYGRKAATYAAERGSRELVDLLAARGASLAEPSMTAAAARNPDARVMARVLEVGAPVDGEPGGESPLEVAACMPNEAAVRALLARGARTQRIHGDDDVLAAAAACGQPQIFPLLPADEASRTRALYVSIEQREPQSIRALLVAGADPNTIDATERQSAFAMAIQSGEAEYVRWMLEGGARLDTPAEAPRSGRARWPLQIAVDEADVATVELLLGHGANLPAHELPALVEERGARAVAEMLQGG